MKSRPGQGLTEISKKIRLMQNDHASRRTQRSPHTRREQHRPNLYPSTHADSRTLCYRVKSRAMAKISNISLDSISRDECTPFGRAALLATTVSSTLASITPAAK